MSFYRGTVSYYQDNVSSWHYISDEQLFAIYDASTTTPTMRAGLTRFMNNRKGTAKPSTAAANRARAVNFGRGSILSAMQAIKTIQDTIQAEDITGKAGLCFQLGYAIIALQVINASLVAAYPNKRPRKKPYDEPLI